MTYGRQPRINEEINWVTDEDGNVIGYMSQDGRSLVTMVSGLGTPAQASAGSVGLVGATSAGVLVLPDASLYVPIRTYTWASRPIPSAYIGRFWVTDIGASGSLWYSDGTKHGLVNGSVILEQSAVAVAALTGTLTETVLYSRTIPGGLLGLNGELAFEKKLTVTNSANTKTLRDRLGGLAGTVVNDPTLTTSATAHCMTKVQNRNSEASQLGSNGTFNATTSTNAWRSATVDTTVDWVFASTAQHTNTGESIVLEQIKLTLFRP